MDELEALKTKLAARENQGGYADNCRGLRERIAQLTKENDDDDQG